MLENIIYRKDLAARVQDEDDPPTLYLTDELNGYYIWLHTADDGLRILACLLHGRSKAIEIAVDLARKPIDDLAVLAFTNPALANGFAASQGDKFAAIASSDPRYFAVRVGLRGIVHIKADERGIAVDIAPLTEPDEPVASTWADYNELYGDDPAE